MSRLMAVGLLVLCTGQLSSCDDCLDCICQQESGCRPIGCRPDRGSKSCGYLQIKWPYYTDCKKPGGPTKEDWKHCGDDYDCSVNCFHAYMRKYHRSCPEKSGCERIARLHNGGPDGCNEAEHNTTPYWHHIRRCLEQKALQRKVA